MEEKILVNKKLLNQLISFNKEILEKLKSYNNVDSKKYENINIELEDNIRKEEYINNFAKTFEIKNIKIDTSRLPLLKYIVREFGEDLYKPSERNKEIRNEKKEAGDRLIASLTEEQYKNFVQYWDLENEMKEESEEQLFMYGFIMSQELYIEGKTENDKENEIKNC